MEFIASSGGSIIPDPESQITMEQLTKTQSAMDFFDANTDRIFRYKQRVKELNRTGIDTVITLINVDDPVGGILSDILMPGHDWQQYRDAGEQPVAGGLAKKEFIPEFLKVAGYEVAAAELAQTDDLVVLVIDAGVALVLNVQFDKKSV